MISWGKRNRGLLFFQAGQGRAPHPERKWRTTFIARRFKRARVLLHTLPPSRCSTELSQAAQFGGRHVLAETDTPEGYFHFTPLLFVSKS
jgi:hypothetical protein